MDAELEELLKTHKKLEEKSKRIEKMSLNVFAHKRTLVKAIAGSEIQHALAQVVKKNQPYFKADSNLPNTLMIVNLPINTAALSKPNSTIEDYVNYKALRVYFRSKISTSKNKYEIYTTSVIKTGNNVCVEIVDSENNIWGDFKVFAQQFDGFNFDLKSWFGI